MSAALLGDAASVSALVASLRRRAGDLEIRADEADGAHVAAGPGWVGRVAVGHRRRVGEQPRDQARGLVGAEHRRWY